jgi:hypothetical protein
MRTLMKPFVVAAILLLGATVLSTAAASAPSLSSMTLQDADLPSAFSKDFSHSIPSVQVRALQGSMLPGYLNGWQSELTRVHGLRTSAVTSSVLRYASRDQAHAAFVQTWKQIARHSHANTFPARVGQESRAISFPSRLLTAYAVTWRYRNLVGVVAALGLNSQGVTQQFTRHLATEQQSHMASAA